MISVAEMIGTGLLCYRRLTGLTQEELALMGRQAGLSWTRSTITAFENGRRRTVGLEEFIVICAITGIAPADWLVAENWLSMNDIRRMLAESGSEEEAFLTADDDKPVVDILEWLSLNDKVEIRPNAIRAMFSGVDEESWSIPKGGSGLRDSPAYLERFLVEEARVWWPEATEEQLSEALYATGDTEFKAARKLGVSPVALQAAAFRLWGHGFASQRDALVRESSEPSVDPRRVQALRGAVTKRLLKELEPHLPHHETGDQ